MLVAQFLDYGANQRTDQWGGSVENRARFGLEVLKVLVKVFGPGRVGLKVSPTGGFNDVGYVLSLQVVINLNVLMLLRVS
jgi:2,4-dienoyl-CoA reductase-like NADH-dependent reductase (Old Yellow Enzyme family)